ncbi:hypothetical protein A6035_13195 [Dietzia lutea]|uniref:Uncharacterized protein n=1 Tax=Dietzia lutea TaxID=546160 RepID=A0A2S1R9Q9_9ACTN|nr:hypothetical protein A6035_13195 [Dietzia lutea]
MLEGLRESGAVGPAGLMSVADAVLGIFRHTALTCGALKPPSEAAQVMVVHWVERSSRHRTERLLWPRSR